MTASNSPARTSIWPGLAVALAAALISLALNRVVPVLSALLVAILLGIVVGNLRPVPASWQPGVKIAQKPLLRAGIVLLGLKVSLGDIAGLGWPVVALVVVIVAVGMVGTYLIGRALKVDADLAMLVASGFSICGAAAVAAADGVLRPARKEHAATALGLVVLFGTLMIGVVPLVALPLGMPGAVSAIWAGGGTHEVAQVVAIGGILGGGPVLATAVIVKLARVVMLAPVMVGIGLWARRRTTSDAPGARPPLVPLFVLGFLGAVLIRTFVPLPAPVLFWADVAQTILLSAAMFALGLGVNRKVLAQASGGALLLGLLSTLLVNAIALGGAYLVL